MKCAKYTKMSQYTNFLEKSVCIVTIKCAMHTLFFTVYVGLARAVSPTNTNFRLTFLLTRLQEALYEDLAV